jgi:hypothetical protein
MNDALCLILTIELLDVLDVNMETGLLGDISVIVATEKNFDGIACNNCHFGGLPLGILGRKTKLLHIKSERGIDITPGRNERAQVPQDRAVVHGQYPLY